MSEHRKAAELQAYPAVDEEVVDVLLRDELHKSNRKIVVLDDDPTGVQTVHDVSVYTDWTEDSIRAGFAEENRLFYILTNSRGFTAEQTAAAHREMAERIMTVARESGLEPVVISRSDSTLRGHYPLETQTLREVMEETGGIPIDGEVLCPFFKEGGRYTLDNIHYVRYGEELVPAGETEFARDRTFGYTSSDLRAYIAEKTHGAYPAEEVVCISLDELRALQIEEITEKLMAVHDFQKIVVNAVDYVDVKLFCVALYRALARGRHFLFRSAAALVKCMGGIDDQPLLTRRQMIRRETAQGGIVVVGSHTQKTTAQLENLLTLPGTEGIEFQSDLVLAGEAAFEAEITRVVEKSEALIRAGKTPVCYTNRRLLTVENDTKEAALLRSVRISEGVQSLVGRLQTAPAFVVAKGGITSSDIGTKALQVKRAVVMGQIRPGIPVWETGSDSRFPGIPYVIFPGNVGDDNTLKEAVGILLGKNVERTLASR